MRTRTPLPNDFSVAQSCFGCGPANPHSLGLAFEAVGESVEARFCLGEQFSGAPAFVHGGIVMTVLDEAMAWSTIGIRRRFALTKSFTASFEVPVMVKGEYVVRAFPGPVLDGDRELQVRGEVVDAAGGVCATAEGTYWIMTAEETAAAVNLPELTDEFAAYEFPPVVPGVLVTDSTAYLSPDLAARLKVRVVPLHVSLGDWTFAEPEVEPRAFYARLRDAGGQPTTSQPAPGDFLAAFDAAAAAGAERVLCITCSSALSGTYQSATVAAGLASVPVDVVDSGTMSGGLLLTISTVGRALSGGATYDEALALARSMAGRVWSTWSSDTTALLAAGGRLADDVPDGVPILALEGGGMRVLGAARTVEESVRLQAETILASAAAYPTRVAVGHGDVPELADALEQALLGQPGIEGVDRYVVGPVVGAHAGPGNFGASYLVPPPS